MKKSKEETVNADDIVEETETETDTDAAEEANADDATENAETEQTEAETAETGESGDVRYLRLAADFQNYKKRTEKERFERYSEGKKDFAADILPVLDNFDRALAGGAAQATDEQDRAFVSGMEMILKQFIDTLEKNGVTEIAALGEDFDPNVHHAVVMEPSDKYGSQKVSEVLLKGYRIGDKVIRPTMVKVAE
jgi:molecular chaperone GrpE